MAALADQVGSHAGLAHLVKQRQHLLPLSSELAASMLQLAIARSRDGCTDAEDVGDHAKLAHLVRQRQSLLPLHSQLLPLPSLLAS